MFVLTTLAWQIRSDSFNSVWDVDVGSRSNSSPPNTFWLGQASSGEGTQAMGISRCFAWFHVVSPGALLNRSTMKSMKKPVGHCLSQQRSDFMNRDRDGLWCCSWLSRNVWGLNTVQLLKAASTGLGCLTWHWVWNDWTQWCEVRLTLIDALIGWFMLFNFDSNWIHLRYWSWMHGLEVCLLCSLELDFFALCGDFSSAVHLRHLFLEFLPCQVYEGGWTFVYIWLHLLPTYRDYKESWHWFVWEVFTFQIWFMNLETSRHETLMEFKASRCVKSIFLMIWIDLEVFRYIRFTFSFARAGWPPGPDLRLMILYLLPIAKSETEK